MLGTISHDLHRNRRAALNPYFSKQSIRRLEPHIHRVLAKALGRLAHHAETGAPINMNMLYSAITSDIISNYCFGPTEDNLDKDDLNEAWFRAFTEAGNGFHLSCFCPWITDGVKTLPVWIVLKIMPVAEIFIILLKARLRRILLLIYCY